MYFLTSCFICGGRPALWVFTPSAIPSPGLASHQWIMTKVMSLLFWDEATENGNFHPACRLCPFWPDEASRHAGAAHRPRRWGWSLANSQPETKALYSKPLEELNPPDNLMNNVAAESSPVRSSEETPAWPSLWLDLRTDGAAGDPAKWHPVPDSSDCEVTNRCCFELLRVRQFAMQP